MNDQKGRSSPHEDAQDDTAGGDYRELNPSEGNSMCSAKVMEFDAKLPWFDPRLILTG